MKSSQTTITMMLVSIRDPIEFCQPTHFLGNRASVWSSYFLCVCLCACVCACVRKVFSYVTKKIQSNGLFICQSLLLLDVEIKTWLLSLSFYDSLLYKLNWRVEVWFEKKKRNLIVNCFGHSVVIDSINCLEKRKIDDEKQKWKWNKAQMDRCISLFQISWISWFSEVHWFFFFETRTSPAR